MNVNALSHVGQKVRHSSQQEAYPAKKLFPCTHKDRADAMTGCSVFSQRSGLNVSRLRQNTQLLRKSHE